MVDEQIRRRGVHDERVLDAMLHVSRELFCPPDIREAAYEDRALPIGGGQTISQPFIVGYMTEQLSMTSECRVLEIGTGTGYQTAVLAFLCAHVFTVERIDTLRDLAAMHLAGRANVSLFLGDGSLGLAECAPYDRILVTAAAPGIPGPLVDQLVPQGRLILPVGGANEQTIVRVERRKHRTIETPLLACRFVKLIGKEGWK
jgi:protein-L-isoaspartate(D-aspartate) O-methyltransferase